jgi:hypothetical protein
MSRYASIVELASRSCGPAMDARCHRISKRNSAANSIDSNY